VGFCRYRLAKYARALVQNTRQRSRINQHRVRRVKKKSTAQRIFISREVEGSSALYKFAKHYQHTLIAKSCVEISHQAFSVEEPYQWVFFTSKHSVKSYLKQQGKERVNYAALGEATAGVAQQQGLSLSFIGEGDVEHVAQQFKTKLNATDKVLFPISDVSLKHVQSTLAQQQVINAISYTTKAKAVSVPEADVYIFTSPSNVEAFLKHNSIPSNAKTIAIGNATAQQLKQCGIGKVFTSWSYSELALLDCV